MKYFGLILWALQDTSLRIPRHRRCTHKYPETSSVVNTMTDNSSSLTVSDTHASTHLLRLSGHSLGSLEGDSVTSVVMTVAGSVVSEGGGELVVILGVLTVCCNSSKLSKIVLIMIGVVVTGVLVVVATFTRDLGTGVRATVLDWNNLRIFLLFLLLFLFLWCFLWFLFLEVFGFDFPPVKLILFWFLTPKLSFFIGLSPPDLTPKSGIAIKLLPILMVTGELSSAKRGSTVVVLTAGLLPLRLGSKFILDLWRWVLLVVVGPSVVESPCEEPWKV